MRIEILGTYFLRPKASQNSPSVLVRSLRADRAAPFRLAYMTPGLPNFIEFRAVALRARRQSVSVVIKRYGRTTFATLVRTLARLFTSSRHH